MWAFCDCLISLLLYFAIGLFDQIVDTKLFGLAFGLVALLQVGLSFEQDVQPPLLFECQGCYVESRFAGRAVGQVTSETSKVVLNSGLVFQGQLDKPFMVVG